MENKIGKIKYSIIPFGIVTGVVLICQAVLFYRYSEAWDYIWHNTVAKYLFNREASFAEIEPVCHVLTYPLYHIVMKVMHIALRIDYAFAGIIELVVANFITIILCRKVVTEITHVNNSYLIDIVSCFSCVFGVLVSFLTDYRFYARHCGPNPFHNPTIIIARAFGWCATYAFVHFVKEFDEEIEGKYKWIFIFSIMLTLSVISKPSYAITFLPGMGIMILILMIRKKSFIVGLITLAAVLPSLCLMVIQEMYISLHSSAMNLVISFGGFSQFTIREVFFVTIASVPTIITLFKWGELKKNYYAQVTFLALLFGWIQMFFLSNGGTGDFSWGYDLSIQASTIVFLAMGIDMYKRHVISKKRIGFALLIYGYQCVCGCIYMYLIYSGGIYFI